MVDTISNRINKSKDFPSMFHIEPTNICNQRCTMCPQSVATLTRPEGFIELRTVKRIIDEAKQYHDQVDIELYNDGEALFHPQLCKMIRYATENSCITHVSTNGVLLREDIVKNLIKSGLTHLTISALAYNREQNKAIKQCDNFNVLYENIRQVKKIRDDLGYKTPIIRIKTLSVFNEDKFREVWSPYCDFIHVSYCHNFGGLLEQSHNSHKNPCSYLWVNPVINWNGDVSICCVDYSKQAIIGNIHRNSLHEIWNGKEMKRYRDAHLNEKDILPCSLCSQWDEIPSEMTQKINGWGSE